MRMRYLIVHQMGVTLAQLAQIALNGVRMSWMDESEKQATLTEWSRELGAILR
jgi:adenosine deaminase